MQIRINVDRKAILDQLYELGQDRQGPFILARGLNLLAKKVQDNLREDLSQSLGLNRAGWLKQQISIRSGTWATKTRLVVRIEVLDKADFLSGFEGGAEHMPTMGHKFMVMPNPKVFGKSRIVGPDNPLRIRNLNFHTTPWGLQGDQRTFVIHTKNTNTPLVMQRIGPEDKGKARKGVNKISGARVLYALIKHSHRPSKIHWASVSSATVSNEQTGIFTEVMRDAIAKARPK